MQDVFRIYGRTGDSASTIPANTIRSVLFVCYGNLMRSPMAEIMLKRSLAERGVGDVVVKSAGLHAVPGREAHTWAIAASRELGMPLDLHRAQCATPELIANSDLVLAMDFANLAELMTRCPGAKHKIGLLSSYAQGKQRNREIPDPYFGDLQGTRDCYAIINGCVDNLARALSSSRQLVGISAGLLENAR